MAGDVQMAEFVPDAESLETGRPDMRRVRDRKVVVDLDEGAGDARTRVWLLHHGDIDHPGDAEYVDWQVIDAQVTQ